MILESGYRWRESIMGLLNPDEENLFCKSLRVQLKESLSNQTRTTNLHISVKKVSTSNLGRKELLIQITDESDPFFMYTLTLTEEDFHCLKSQQGLLVDFMAFPQKFIDLLEHCFHDESRDSPKFILIMSIQGGIGRDPAFLDVVETNPFKHLCHLSLKFLPSPESFVKKYLATCLKTLKEEKSRLESCLRNTEVDFQERMKVYSETAFEKERELNSVKEMHALELSRLREQHQRELMLERDRLQKVNSEIQLKSDIEKHDQEQKLKKQVQHLESQSSLLETLNKDLQDKLKKSESLNRELQNKVSNLEESLHHYQQKIQILNKESETAVAESRDREKNVHQLQMRVSTLEQEISSRDQVKSQMQELLTTAQEQKRKVEELLEQKQAQLSRRETALKTLSDDVMKGNEIIKKLQGEIRNYHTKLKIRSEVITKQESAIMEKEQQIQQLTQSLESAKVEEKKASEELVKLKGLLETAQHKQDEYQKQIKTNENVIQWLNKQLNGCEISKKPNLIGQKQTQPLPGTFSRPPFSSQVPMSYGISQPNLGGPLASGIDRTNTVPKITSEPLVDPKYFHARNDIRCPSSFAGSGATRPSTHLSTTAAGTAGAPGQGTRPRMPVTSGHIPNKN